MAQTSVLDYIRHTPNNSNVNVVKGMLGNSDGGNSDWSTAEVTINITSGEWYFNFSYLTSETIKGVGLLHSGNYTFTVPLYKGKCIITSVADEEEDTILSGSVVFDNSKYIVTGNCTITTL